MDFSKAGCGDLKNRSERTVFQHAFEQKAGVSSHSDFLRPRTLIKKSKKP